MVKEYERGVARPSVTGEGSYILTDCKNWWFSIDSNPMRRDNCICPRCGKIVKVDMKLLDAIKDRLEKDVD